jgi:hypothetical protein
MLEAAMGVDVPKSWLLENAHYALDPPFHTARLPMLRWPLRSAWGANGVPIKDLFQMFGGHAIRVIRELPDTVDVASHTLLSTFQALSDGCGPGADASSFIDAAVSLIRHSKLFGHRFQSDDVKNAFKRTKVGMLVAKKCRGVDIVSLIHRNELESGALDLTDVCDLHRLVYARHHAISRLISFGSKFGIVDTMRILGARALPLVSQGGCVATSTQDVVRACQVLANRRGKQSRWILSLLRAICKGRIVEPDNVCVHECSEAEGAIISALVPIKDRDEVHKIVHA